MGKDDGGARLTVHLNPLLPFCAILGRVLRGRGDAPSGWEIAHEYVCVERECGGMCLVVAVGWVRQELDDREGEVIRRREDVR